MQGRALPAGDEEVTLGNNDPYYHLVCDGGLRPYLVTGRVSRRDEKTKAMVRSGYRSANSNAAGAPAETPSRGASAQVAQAFWNSDSRIAELWFSVENHPLRAAFTIG